MRRCMFLLLPPVLLLSAMFTATAQQVGPPGRAHDELIAEASRKGSVPVIIRLDTDRADIRHKHPDFRPADPDADKRERIRHLSDALTERMDSRNMRHIKPYRNIPFMAGTVDAEALRALLDDPAVLRVYPDLISKPMLETSTEHIGAADVHSGDATGGITGEGTVIAILDTGMDPDHDFYKDRITAQACFSTTFSNDENSSVSLCPDGDNPDSVDTQIGGNAGKDCDTAISGCGHGTHVGGIAAGSSDDRNGVAPDAVIISIQVFSYFDEEDRALSWGSDQIRALDWLIGVADTTNLVAANLSLGYDEYYSGYCDERFGPYTEVIDALKESNVATIFAAGNSGKTDKIIFPSCISSAISVGATRIYPDETPPDRIAESSNNATILDLLAPGRGITSSVPGGGYGTKNGTSMAAPHVTGAWALVRQAWPDAPVDDVLHRLTTSGVQVADHRTENGYVTPRIQVDDAVLSDEEPLFIRKLHQNEGFRLLSVPAASTFADFLDPVWTQGMDSEESGGNTTGGDTNVFLWDHSSSGGDASGWQGLSGLTGNIAPGTGFLVYVYEDDDPGQDGITGGFPKTLAVSGEEFGEVSPHLNPDKDGFTLLGNPFASTIAFSELERSGLTDVVYVWDPNDDGNGETDGESGENNGGIGGGSDESPPSGRWLTWDAGAGIGDLTDGLIAPFQGFFVQTADDDPKVAFTDAAKSSDGSFYGKPEAQEQLTVRLDLSGQGLRSSAWLRSGTNGSLEEQVRGDALKLRPLSSHYALLAMQKKDGTLLDISHLPVPDAGFEVPLSADATIGGTYTLRVTDFEYTGSESLFLVDRVKNKSLPLNDDLSYKFELDSPALKKAVANPLEAINRGSDKAVADENEPRFVISAGGSVDAESGAERPSELALSQNYPNPFNPVTKISYDLPEEQHVRLTVYDMLGREVSVLVDEVQAPGSYDASWDASQLSSGVYLYRLESGGQTLTRKMTLIK